VAQGIENGAELVARQCHSIKNAKLAGSTDVVGAKPPSARTK
jgi:hypothetical protein